MGQNMDEFLMATVDELRTERDTLIRQRAADVEALNAVQALHAQAVAERDEARRQVEAMREVVEAARREMWQSMNLPIREAIERLDAIAVPSTEVEG
jgi:predicted phage gp36 major capsid-like protein